MVTRSTRPAAPEVFGAPGARSDLAIGLLAGVLSAWAAVAAGGLTTRWLVYFVAAAVLGAAVILSTDRERFLSALFLLSLTGIPPTAGFFAKAYVILSAVQAGGLAAALAIVAVLNAAIAAFYYLRVIVYLFMRDPAENEVQVATAPLLRVGLLIAAAGTILLGLLPGGLIEAVVQALAI